MLALIQVERVFVPPKPKIYSTVSAKGNSEQEDEVETESKPSAKAENHEEEVIRQFKITEVHVAGLKTESSKINVPGNPKQQQSGSRWLLATGIGKSNKHPFMKSRTVAKPSKEMSAKVQPGDTLWSISSRIHDSGAKWRELAALNPHIRNPDIIFPSTQHMLNLCYMSVLFISLCRVGIVELHRCITFNVQLLQLNSAATHRV